MNVAQFLLNIKNEHNGHKQTEIRGLSVEEGIHICRELEKEFDNKVSFTLELWTDGTFTIWEKNEFDNKNRIILSSVK